MNQEVKIDVSEPSALPVRSPVKQETKAGVRDFSMPIALVLIAAYFWSRDPTFLGARNLSQLTIEIASTAVLALGMLLVILPGQIDLSVGSGLGLAGGVAAVLITNYGWSPPIALLVTLVLTVVVYAGMGTLIVRERIPAFIITLGGLLVFKGLHFRVIKNETIPIVAGGHSNVYSLLTTFYLPKLLGYALCVVFVVVLGASAYVGQRRKQARGLTVDWESAFLKWILAAQVLTLFVVVMNQYKGVPLAALVLLAVALGVHVLTKHVRFGRYLYAIGGNEEAALVSGVPISAVVIAAFALIGVVVALAGFLQTAFAGASTTTTGQLMELDAIAACVIGGTSLRGGRGNVLGVLFGALIMATLLNGMTLLAFSPETKLIARGIVLALAVWMDVRLAR